MKTTGSLSVAALAALLTAASPLSAGSRVPPVASYAIEATYDAESHTLTGRETVTFVNRTGRALPDLRLHLYLNAWRNDRSTWLKESEEGVGRRRPKGKDAEWFGWSEINRIALTDGTDLTPGLTYLAPDDGNAEDRTLVSVPLPQPDRARRDARLLGRLGVEAPAHRRADGVEGRLRHGGPVVPQALQGDARRLALPAVPRRRPSSGPTSATTTSRSPCRRR